MQISTPIYSKLPAFLVTIGAAIIYFTLLAGATGFWDQGSFPALFSFKHGAAFGLLCFAIATLLSLRSRALPSFSPTIWGYLVLLFLFTDWLSRGYNFFQGPLIRGELFVCAALSWILIRNRNQRYFAWLLPGTIALGTVMLLQSTAGRTLFSDDLGTFLYRLQLLKENFPFIPFYNPQWNGGIDQRDFFATGALNVFTLFSPIIYLFNLFSSFNWILIGILFVLTPASTFTAARLFGQRGIVPYLAASLVMVTGLLWYRWALAYGTLGFLVSSALYPLVISIISIAIDKEHPLRRGIIALFCVSFTLMLFWSLSGFACVPAFLCALCFLGTIAKKRSHAPLIRIGLILILINVLWIVPFLVVSNVGSFLSAKSKQPVMERGVTVSDGATPISTPQHSVVNIKGGSHKLSLKGSVKVLRESVISTNPLILILVLPGIFLLAGRTRILVGCTLAWLAGLGIVAGPVWPHLELDRMLVLFSVLACTPTAVALNYFFNEASEGRSRLTTACLGGFLLLGPFALGNFLEGRTLVRFTTAGELFHELVDSIKTHGGEGRTLFSGLILHEVDGGHIAPFALLTGKPLMASSHVHNIWRYTQIIPKEFLLQGPSGIERYLDLYNVTAVIAHERPWRQHFLKHSDKYELLTQKDRFFIFRRRGALATYFLEGQGSIEKQDSNSVTFKLQTPEAIIKFNYLPFLTAEGCTLAPAPQEGGVNLIKLTECKTNTLITLKSKGIFDRIFN